MSVTTFLSYSYRLGTVFAKIKTGEEQAVFLNHLNVFEIFVSLYGVLVSVLFKCNKHTTRECLNISINMSSTQTKSLIISHGSLNYIALTVISLLGWSTLYECNEIYLPKSYYVLILNHRTTA